jgi:hypothetical protein
MRWMKVLLHRSTYRAKEIASRQSKEQIRASVTVCLFPTVYHREPRVQLLEMDTAKTLCTRTQSTAKENNVTGSLEEVLEDTDCCYDL